MQRATRNISLILLLVLWPSSAFALLGVGDKAPPLTISDWVKGAPVDFGKDIGKKIYVVEFWATWCPPCKASVPRLTDFQQKYRKDVTIIGVTSLDNRGNSKSAVRRFVKEKGSAMDYTVAIDKDEKTSNAYMLAAGAMGIPHSFVVGREGHILWQGSPLDPELEIVLKQVVDGTYDISKAKIAGQVLDRFQQLEFPAQMGQWSVVWDGLVGILKIDPGNEEALDVLMQIYINETRDVPAFRKWASSHIATNRSNGTVLRRLAAAMCANGDLTMRTPDLALEAAKAAYDNTQQRETVSTVVYARAVYQIGDLDRAIGLQKEALTIADVDTRSIVQGGLDFYMTCKQLRESMQ